MAIAFDAFAVGATGTTNRSWTHTPVGTPRAALAVILNLNGENPSTAATYGGVAMTKAAGAPVVKATGEVGAVDIWFLGANVPTGAQTVEITVNGSGTKAPRSYTLTAGTDTYVVDTAAFNSDSLENPSDTLALGGIVSWAMVAFLSGQDDVTGITPLANWTADNEADPGTVTAGCYRYDTVAGTDITAGWTQAAEDAIGLAVAVAERRPTHALPAVGGGGLVGPLRHSIG
jgi:hypothetical protein